MYKFLLFLIPLFAISEENFQNMIQKIMKTIQQEKSGIQDSSLSNIQNPFFIKPLKTSSDIQTNCFDFDIKTATKNEFLKIPNIDRFIANKIILYRKTHLVSRPEDLIYVIGFTVKKVNSIRNYIDKKKCIIKKEVVKKKVFRKKYKRKIAKKRFQKLKIQIIFNSKVKILNRWYKVGDKIQNYKISKITSNSVILAKGSKEKILSLFTKKYNKFKFE